ncbi:MAG TPA: hypothetical protein PKD12_20785 [Nitrospira sp.]|nr:hypothetical protein [Nitrospira sp.]
MCRPLLAVSLLLFACQTNAPASALAISIDPGAVGSEFSRQHFDFFDLGGTPLHGQTHSITIGFATSKFLVGKELQIDLFLNQSGDVGTLPADGYAVSGYLLNSGHETLGTATNFSKNLEMPAQIWPGWPYTRDGQPFLPPTVGFGQRLSGTIVDDIPGPDYSIDPLVLYGVHFDIRLPNSPGNNLIGSRLQFSNLDSPILISPDPIPRYLVDVPELRSSLLMTITLLGMVVLYLIRGRANREQAMGSQLS